MTILIFVDAGDNASAYPSERLIAMSCSGNATLKLIFESSQTFGPDYAVGIPAMTESASGGATETSIQSTYEIKTATVDVVTLTITADTEKKVMRSIAERIASNESSSVVIADDVSTEYISSYITACSIDRDAGT